MNETLALSVDTLVEDVHFTRHTPAALLGYKCVAVNLSDMAAMGAMPLTMQCAWSDPQDSSPAQQQWQIELVHSLKQAAKQANTDIDIVRVTAPRRQISIQIMGQVPRNAALTRSGARAGDALWVSGTVGDAGAGLAIFLQGENNEISNDAAQLLTRFHQPSARVELGCCLRSIASAAIDVSDGINGDAAHIAGQSGVGMRIFAENLPISAALMRELGPQKAQQLALSAGEDYELLFTAAASHHERVRKAAADAGVAVTCIGEAIERDQHREHQIIVLDSQGQEIRFDAAFDHFAMPVGRHS